MTIWGLVLLHEKLQRRWSRKAVLAMKGSLAMSAGPTSRDTCGAQLDDATSNCSKVPVCRACNPVAANHPTRGAHQCSVPRGKGDRRGGHDSGHREQRAEDVGDLGPQLKENGPQVLADIVMPSSFDGPTLTLEGNAIEIADADGLANRRYVWVPSLNAILGGVLLFSGVHVWTADTQSAEARAAWVRNLDAMAVRNPAVVVPGHMMPDTAVDSAGHREKGTEVDGGS